MRAKTIPTLLALLALLVPVDRSGYAQTAVDIAVVVNPKNSATNLSMADLRNTFSGQKHTWPGGAPIKILVRGPGSHERLTLLRILAMSESDYKQYWTAQVIRGEADAEPLILPSFGMTKEALKAFPGAIALAEVGDIKPGMELKILKIDGHLPGEDGYPLH
jgi:ABC-type phosphate transport system substrate-binding protein